MSKIEKLFLILFVFSCLMFAVTGFLGNAVSATVFAIALVSFGIAFIAVE